jgi:thiosulfate/3-mercaptopyruvate sulfurtransferase
MTKLVELSTNELVKLLENKNTKIIDVRPVDAYNGWKLENEARGGHIKGAKSLPVKWTNYMDWIEIISSKGILPDRKIVVYGYNKVESEKVTNRFLHVGYRDVNIYNHFIDEWSLNPELPMEQLPRHRQLVSADWVNTLISETNPPEYNNNKFVICQAHYRNRDAYLSGHIPGAIEIDTLALEAPETWNRRSPEELKTALEKHGITTDTSVILYGKFM